MKKIKWGCIVVVGWFLFVYLAAIVIGKISHFGFTGFVLVALLLLLLFAPTRRAK